VGTFGPAAPVRGLVGSAVDPIDTVRTATDRDVHMGGLQVNLTWDESAMYSQARWGLPIASRIT
jgi:hypothetical protein